jgi:hypothetical protein
MSINPEWKDEIFSFIDETYERLAKTDPNGYAETVISHLHKKYKMSFQEAAEWIKSWTDEFISKIGEDDE